MTDRPDKSHSIPALNELRAEFVRVAQAESRPSPSRRRLRPLALALGGLALVAAVVTAGIVLTSDPDRATPPQGPRPGGLAASGPMFGSLEELVAEADLVVVGTVEGVQLGRVFDDDPDYPTRELNTVLSMEDVLKGSAPAGKLTVATLELAYAGPPGRPSTDWRKPGKRVLAFLSKSKEGRPLYIPTSYVQSFYILEGDDLLAAAQGEPKGSLSERIEAMSLLEFRRAVEQAAAVAEDE